MEVGWIRNREGDVCTEIKQGRNREGEREGIRVT